MDLEDLTPADGSLRSPVAPPAHEPVATFTRPVVQHPDAIWSPRGSEIAPPQRPLPGHGLEHEPVNKTERESFDLDEAAGNIRAALRPGF